MRSPFLYSFEQSIQGIDIPNAFTFPFEYEPHPLAHLAVKQVQKALDHPFFQKKGKMFGVLVVKLESDEIGFLVTCSGHPDVELDLALVPPVVNLREKTHFYQEGSRQLDAINAEVRTIEQNPEFILAKEQLEKLQHEAKRTITQFEKKYKEAKIKRQEQRKMLAFDKRGNQALIEKLNHESQQLKSRFKMLKRDWKAKLQEAKEALEPFEKQMNDLRNARKNLSSGIQQEIFEAYQLLNITGKRQSIPEIFGSYPIPAGTGDCATPKLLQHAFEYGLEPLAMAEFWWGKTPDSEIRHHGNFYPACTAKCKPILVHMLSGIPIMPDPRGNRVIGALDVLFEDEAIWVVNKPSGLLSSPGKDIQDSVTRRLGAFLVHRLDQDTSGLMVLVKQKEWVEPLQRQFRKRQVNKEYIAVLDGVPKTTSGVIDLPIARDYNHRPRQKVSHKTGKAARTFYEVLEVNDNETRILFKPITGRTHQLRLHAAHSEGLHCPIVGDPFYGHKGKRLLLHAARLKFFHPLTHQPMSFSSEPNF